VDSETSLMLDRPAGVQREVSYLVDDLDLVFCQYNGKPLDPDGVSKHFKKSVRAAGFPEMRFHDLRYPHLNKIRTFSKELPNQRKSKEKGSDNKSLFHRANAAE
jgi:hypothetical protein